MSELQDLKRRFAVPDLISLDVGENGLPRFRLTTPHAEAHVYLHGAHVTHYHPRGAKQPALFMSNKSWFEPGKPIRGGVPLIFPWFGPHPTRPDLPAHGFARTQPWTPVEAKRFDDGRAAVSLALTPNEFTRRLWPHEFELRFTVTVGPELEMALEVRNTTGDAFTYEEALHTYLTVGDIRQVQAHGLSGRPFIDKMDAGARKTQSGPVTFAAETDRVYVDTPDTVVAHDPVLNRRIAVLKDNSLATVVWNPWTEKARRMTDFGDDEWPGMLCIETANAADHAVTLAPGRSHVMRAAIHAE